MAPLRTEADRPTILLVDDRRENLLALEALLGELGHRLLSVTSGEAAVEAARDQDFALILLDVRMPGMSGLEAARAIKDMPRHRATPIIFVTANGVLPGNVSPYAAGGVDVLFKPLDIEALRAKVTTFAELWELRRREAQRLREEADRAAEETRRASAKREERRRTLLAEATRVFAGSLDLAPTLTGIAQLFVPDLADSATLHLLEDGKIVHAVTAHLRPGKEDVVRTLHEHAGLLEKDLPAHAHAIATGSRATIALVDEGRVRAIGAADEPTLEAVRELGPVSLIAVPLLAHGRPLGALTLSSRTSVRRYGEEEISVISELAQHASSAIDNARLFRLAQEERRRADEANRTKDEFLAVVSHELRTPLNAILGWAKMLGKGGLDERKTARALETIERNAKAQARLIEDLLDISRIMTGKLKLELDRVDPEEPIASAIEVVRPAADAKGVTLRPPARAQLGPVMADPNRLQQAVWNLLANAVKFTPADGEVRVRLERDGRDYVVVVEDTGVGIDPQFLPHVFDRFRQAEMGSARAHGGLGLGLSIVKHIAELHGGKVEAFSEGLGRGSTFRLRLPIAPQTTPAVSGEAADARAIAPRPQGAEPVRSPIDGLAILVVDDELDAREMLSSMLEQCNASVVTAASAEEGVRAIERKRPDVIISDVGMPIEDGYAFIHRVRALPPERGGKTPAIALTAYANTADRTKALLAGFDMHLPKPIDPTELLAALANVTRTDAASGGGQRTP